MASGPFVNAVLQYLSNAPGLAEGLDAAKPTLGNVTGFLYLATDTQILYRWTGSAWVVVLTSAAGTVPTLQQVVNAGDTVSAAGTVKTMRLINGTAGIVLSALLQTIVAADAAGNQSTFTKLGLANTASTGDTSAFTAFVLQFVGSGGDVTVITSTYMTIQDFALVIMTFTKQSINYNNGTFSKTLDFSLNPPTANRAIGLQDGSGTLAFLSDVPDTSLVAINAQSGTTYTFVLTDKGKLVTGSNAAATIYTVPTNASVAFAVGTQIAVAQVGAGRISLAAAGGVTINSKGGNISTSAQYVQLLLTKTATNTWLLCGDLGP